MSIISRRTHFVSSSLRTLITSSFLFRCFSIWSMVLWSPVETMVILEISFRSVTPTARLSMLKALLAKSPEIWDRTPSLFSTSTEKIPFMLCSSLFGVIGAVDPADHDAGAVTG